uniref:Beta-amylase n=1 Tax=Pyramimonas obovata TaxID=1411642 RepID=A0A7S0N1D2_9CHLO|mmetsp:Transcript_15915/g.34509  ORF Transcript_15915/g.34509 Transcript_15915/m.34509 type:complete len:631 (+) Transcript_15915:335-2227(+)|eukprot:CAMPEP_0118949364 /NCGR_PEP_ID=MMETSP1169-20130426/49477_1 /TAXON_ID=36882 /ORGANISM="Pyramimonas obovata, Strain CCMP722" /LENGTH=630 /DNA_ID=CAMNT_0006895979 /DNA_START=272 /DNA_END=2164 /DNA_ORIENTATION=-
MLTTFSVGGVGAPQRSQLGSFAGFSGDSFRASIPLYYSKPSFRQAKQPSMKLGGRRFGGQKKGSSRWKSKAHAQEGDTGESNSNLPTPLPQPIKESQPHWVEEFADPLQDGQDSVESQLVPGEAGVGFFGLVSESELVREDGLPLLRQGNPEVKQSAVGVPMYVALPLGAISHDNKLRSRKALRAALRALKLVGVEGVTANVWWGLVEKEGPQSYDWSAYEHLISMLSEEGLKFQCVFAFHQVPDLQGSELPPWVMEVARGNSDVLFTDRGGQRSYDCLSFSVDDRELFHGRSALQMYKDLMISFRNQFASELGGTIADIVVGMGPNGELRYPSYPEDGRWAFPGIGEFQCYDKYMMEDLARHAESIGKPEWGHGGPHDAGSYKQWPHETVFFEQENGGWSQEYGQFFLGWYCGRLVEHGRRVSLASQEVFGMYPVHLLAKVAGVHWWYLSDSHAAELTAGYFNTRSNDGYKDMMQMFKEVGFGVILTCAEMQDDEQPEAARCSPERLVDQVVTSAIDNGVPIAGENAFQRYDAPAHGRILHTAQRLNKSFAFLRMGKSMFEPVNWVKFVRFVQQMKHVRQPEALMALEEAGDDAAHPPLALTFEEIPDSPLEYHKQLNREQHRQLIERQ